MVGALETIAERWMRGLLYGTELDPSAPPPLDATPMQLVELDDPVLIADDWVVLRTRLCGICGSDAKQVFGDGEPDNAMTALISFPQVLGHEVVATVEEVGPAANVEPGARVVLNPWLSCAPRGFGDDPCPACTAGDLALCHRFTDGPVAVGIHTGTSATATGGFAELLPAHESMCIPVPDAVSDEQAVLADPFSVALHAILRHPPPEGGRVLVYGAGALGSMSVEILRALHPSVAVAVVAKFPAQAVLASRRGAMVLSPEDDLALVEGVAAWTEAPLRRPFAGLPFTHPGGVDVVYDTIGSPNTLEVGVRVVRARGRIVVTGVATPGRFEWTPWYFKELTIVGSNAFGIEQVNGVRQHALAHYLDLVSEGTVDVRDVLTHTWRLDAWHEAFLALADQASSGAVKVAFDHR